jgi:tetratricopeptide (TPR) repeat protein
MNRAIKYFEESLSRDSAYSLAYAGLADCYGLLGYYGYRRPTIAYPRARELVEKALAIDDNLAEAHASLGQILMNFYFDWANAYSELDKALELNPSYATAHFWRATHHAAHGRFGDCLTEIRKAADLDPLSMIILTDQARNLYLAGYYSDAINQYEESLRLDPNFAIAHKGLAEVYVNRGMHAEAVEEIEKAIVLSGRSVFIFDDLGYIYAKSGDKAKALKVVEELEVQASENFVSAWGRAVIYAGLEEKEQALFWLTKAYEERCFVTYIKVDPIFEFLRNDSRFKVLLEKIGL